MSRVLPLALAVAALSLLGACGDDEGEETVTVTETAVTETAVTEAAATETAGDDDGTSTATATVTDIVPGDNHGPRHFQTPTGNIGCYIDATGVRCDIAERDWEPPPPEEPCELDYGQGISLDAGGASFVCAGDTTLGGPATLPYGSTAQRGGFHCDSGEDGVTCSDGTHGFFLSRDHYEIR